MCSDGIKFRRGFLGSKGPEGGLYDQKALLTPLCLYLYYKQELARLKH